MAATRTADGPDIIKELGVLAFATRLRRLGERLQRDVSRLYDERSLAFEAKWFPVLYALRQGKSRSVTSLARSLRLTHPAINQTAGQMARRGWLSSRRDSKDERCRLLRLTAKGKKLALALEPVWKEISQATSELLQQTGCDPLRVLDDIEAGLDKADIYARVWQRRRRRQSGKARE